MPFEKNQKIEIEDVKNKLDGKVSTSDVLTLTDIQANTDLIGKVASAGALKNIISQGNYHSEGETLNIAIKSPCLIVIKGDGNTSYYVGIITRPGYSGIIKILSDGN